jgi:RNase P protein component
LRELVRELVLPTGIALDLVIWAQRSAYDTPFERLRQEVEQVLQRLRRVGSPEA